MGLRIAIVGEPTKGKSTGIFPNENLGIKGLNPDETIILTLSGKKLPIRGGDSLYPKGEKLTDGAKLVHVKDTKLLAPMIKLISDKFPNIKNVVLEDCQYSMSFEFMNRAKEKGLK
jgi:hypothetical protein